MNHNNGNGKNLQPFASTGKVPIIGQPFVMKGWFPTVHIVCACEAKEPVLLVGDAVGVCPACHRGFVIQVKKLEMGIGIVQADAVHAPASDSEAIS